MLGYYLQQRTSADSIFRCNFFLGALRIRLASWNITGFHVHKVEDFIDSFDILGSVETWTHQDSPISLPGYKHVHHTAKKLKKKSRRSGGILVYYKDTIGNGVKLMSQCDYRIWLNLDKNFFGTEFDVYLAVIYSRGARIQK